MQERYLNYSPIKRDKQRRSDTIGFSDYPTYPKLYTFAPLASLPINMEIILGAHFQCVF